MAYNVPMWYEQNTRGTLSFELAGIPVRIMPFAWVVLALLGGGLGINSSAGLVHTLIFVAAGMLTLLAHEFGHALVGRRVGAGPADITIAGMGGVTRHAYLPPTRAGYLAMVAAGPAASLALGLLTGLLFGLNIGNPLAGLATALLAPLPAGVPVPDAFLSALSEGLSAHPLPAVLLQLYLILMGICFWWTAFNLLPIFPLDGGKLLGTLLRNDRLAGAVGLVFSALLVLWSLITLNWFNLMITGWIAYINFQYFRALAR